MSTGAITVADADLRNDEKLREAGKKYADAVQRIVEESSTIGGGVAAYFSEALQSCGGQVIPPPGYFPEVAKHVRDAGGLMVMDEVQTGFGRVGNAYWAHHLYNDGFVADIVTMGKPMGNGFPVSAVVTRKEIADALGGKVGYFNTYGGNPVACAAVLAVMNVLREEHLPEHSERMGELFQRKLDDLKCKYQCIGDIRGVGLFWGIDLVEDRETRAPATELANSLILKLRQDYGILLSVDGPFNNIIKIKPPLCFNENNVLECVHALDEALGTLTALISHGLDRHVSVQTMPKF